MNVLGIDLQPSGLTACLREGRSPTWPPVTAGESWEGERAVAALISRPDPTRESAIDWLRLGKRLERFVGEPLASLDLSRTIFAGSAADALAPALFGRAQWISAGDAALIAAFAEGYAPNPVDRPLLMIVVGELGVEVHGYRLVRDGESALVESAPRPTYIGTGAAFWTSEVARILGDAGPELDVQAHARAIWTGATELASRLTEASDDQVLLPWTGPLVDAMPMVPEFSRSRCRAWPSVALLSEALPPALADVGRQIGAADSPDILIAGVSAHWPFVASLAKRVGAVQVVPRPSLAVARGAAWWPHVGERLFRSPELSSRRRLAGRWASAGRGGTSDDADVDLAHLARLSAPEGPVAE